MRKNILTNEQKEGRRHAVFDLATGYPSFDVPNSLEVMLATWSRESINKGALANSGPWRYADYSVLLADAISSSLKIDRQFHSFLQVTFSGSIAVQRAIVACQELAQEKSRKRCRFVIIEPSVDFYRSLLNEMGIPFVSVVRKSEEQSGAWLRDSHNAMMELATKFPDELIVLLTDSPSNPQGFMVSEEELRELANSINAVGGILIADHCFALAGIHDEQVSAFTFRLTDLSCPWIAIWDTGKTFDLNGDKIAVIIASNDQINEAIEFSLETIQVVPSQRSTIFFSQFLSHPAARDMRLDLQANVTENLHCLHETLTEFSVSRPQGGTFATINVVDTGLSAFQVRSELLQRGIAVSSGSSFYSDLKLGNEIIRIALARPVEVFRESMARLSPLPVRNYR